MFCRKIRNLRWENRYSSKWDPILWYNVIKWQWCHIQKNVFNLYQSYNTDIKKVENILLGTNSLSFGGLSPMLHTAERSPPWTSNFAQRRRYVNTEYNSKIGLGGSSTDIYGRENVQDNKSAIWDRYILGDCSTRIPKEIKKKRWI